MPVRKIDVIDQPVASSGHHDTDTIIGGAVVVAALLSMGLVLYYH